MYDIILLEVDNMKKSKFTKLALSLSCIGLAIVILATSFAFVRFKKPKVDVGTSITTTTEQKAETTTTTAETETISTVAEDTSSKTVETEESTTKSAETSANKKTPAQNSKPSDSSSVKTVSKSENKTTTTTTSPTVTTCNHNWKLLSYTNGCYVYNCSKCDDYKSEEREMNPDDFMGKKSEYMELLGYVNQARREAGLNELVYISEFQAGADTRAQELITSFSHTRPNGQSRGTAYNYCPLKGTVYMVCSENIASGCTTAKSVFNAWMNSEGHRKAIMSEYVTGFVASRCNRSWVMQTFGPVE